MGGETIGQAIEQDAQWKRIKVAGIAIPLAVSNLEPAWLILIEQLPGHSYTLLTDPETLGPAIFTPALLIEPCARWRNRIGSN